MYVLCITYILTYIVFVSMTQGRSSCTNLKYHINTDVLLVLIQLPSLLNQVFSIVSSTTWIKGEGYSRVYSHAERYVVLKIKTSSVCESACCEGHPGSKGHNILTGSHSVTGAGPKKFITPDGPETTCPPVIRPGSVGARGWGKIKNTLYVDSRFSCVCACINYQLTHNVPFK